MKARQFLNQLKKIEKMIANKLEEKARWKEISFGTSAQLGGDKVQASSSQQKMADAVCKYVDLENEIDMQIDSLIDTRKDVISVIEQLGATEYDVLHKIYVQYKTLQEVADIYNNSYNWSKTVHKRALKNVQDILEKRGIEDGKVN